MLNHSEPVLLGGWELLAEAGIFIDAKGPSRSRQDIRAGWKRMEKARSYDELWKVRPFRADGRVVLGGTKRDAGRGLVDVTVRPRTPANNVAGLYSLVATCEANGVNPLDYLSDVLLRVQDHAAAQIDDLLPHCWRPRSA
jgi:hypothetical protein